MSGDKKCYAFVLGFSSPRSSCRVSEIIVRNNVFIYAAVNDLDENEYDFSEDKIPKTIGSQQCHMFNTC